MPILPTGLVWSLERLNYVREHDCNNKKRKNNKRDILIAYDKVLFQQTE